MGKQPRPGLAPHFSRGFCETLLCPMGLFWEPLPLCFYPGMILPAEVQTPGNLRQNSRATEPLLQTPDGICHLGLGCSDWAAATHLPPAQPNPALPESGPIPGLSLLTRCKTCLLSPLNHIARVSHPVKFPPNDTIQFPVFHM